MLERCLDNQQPVIEKINAKVSAAVQRSGLATSPMSCKLREANECHRQTALLAQQRRNELLDKLQEVGETFSFLFFFFRMFLRAYILCF